MGAVLITGGAGFYGVHIAHALSEAGEKVVINYRRSFRVPRILADRMNSRVKAVRCELLDPLALLKVIRENDIESIIHAAIVNNYEASIYTCLQNNVQGTINIMEAAASASVKKVTYISSVSALNGPEGQSAEAEDESLPVASPGVGMIPVSKKVGEILTAFYGATYGISVTAIRPGHSYGPYCGAELGDLRMLRDIMEGTVSGKPVHLPQVGRETKVRMIYVRDSAHAIALVHLAPEHAQRAYCLMGKAYAWGEIADVTKELSPNSIVTFGRNDSPEKEERLPESPTIKSEFGFKPRYGLRDGLREYIEWYRDGQP